MTKHEEKYLKKIWRRLWLSNWSDKEHLELLKRLILERK
jgi:hypothetical protein